MVRILASARKVARGGRLGASGRPWIRARRTLLCFSKSRGCEGDRGEEGDDNSGLQLSATGEDDSGHGCLGVCGHDLGLDLLGHLSERGWLGCCASWAKGGGELGHQA